MTAKLGDYENVIAITGMAGRFPGASDIDSFWKNLVGNVESIKFRTEEELSPKNISSATFANPHFVRASATLDGPELFDANYFNYSPLEAEMIDPQHRFFLECCLEALETAGCDPLTYPGAIGVFGGAALNVYQHLIVEEMRQQIMTSSTVRAMFTHGNDKDFLTTRVSYKLDLRGPSIAVQTACSTSLVAIHLACQSLLAGECDIALAGGVSITESYGLLGYEHVPGGIFSPDGHTRPFDAAARGTVFGDGVGVVVLQRLQQAMDENFSPRALIRGSAVNNDGSNKIGYTAPSIAGQASAITEALAVSGVAPGDISYVEAHGTATELGDPIEVAALTAAFRLHSGQNNFCGLGSVKSNIGHLNTAAGVVGVIKTVLALEHQMLPATLHYRSPNPEINFSDSPFRVIAAPTSWPKGNDERFAGVSSFGIGGTNAHIILQGAPENLSSPTKKTWHVLPISARSKSALETAKLRLRQHLEAHNNLAIGDVAYTLGTGRIKHKYAVGVTCHDLNSAVVALQSGGRLQALIPERADSLAFMFPGQGAQYLNMGRSLYVEFPYFKHQVDECASTLRGLLGMDFRDVLFSTRDDKQSHEDINRTDFAQPAIFALTYATAKLWMHLGVQPTFMIGHSIGEFVAATLAGVMNIEDALQLIALRGKLMQRSQGGSMLAVHGTIAELEAVLPKRVSVAAFNSSISHVLAGETFEIERVEQRLEELHIPTKRLNTSHAFHSSLMAPAAAEFSNAIASMRLRSPKMPFISSASGTLATSEEVTNPDYWAQHMVQTVQFSSGIQTLLQDHRVDCFLEVGPGQALSSFVKQVASDVHRQPTVMASFCNPRTPQDESTQPLMNSVADLWQQGHSICWERIYEDEERRKIPLPTYPFERELYSVRKIDEHPELSQHSSACNEIALSTVLWRRVEHLRGDICEDRLGVCIIFKCDDSLSLELSEAARMRYRKVVLVSASSEFVQQNDLEYSLDPSNPEHYTQLVTALSAQNIIPDSILYLWCLIPQNKSSEITADDLKYKFSGLIHTIQAAMCVRQEASLFIGILTRGIFDVLGTERIDPLAAISLGPSMVGPVEHEKLKCCLIDIENDSQLGNGVLAEQLLEQLSTAKAGGIFAHRGKYFWASEVKELTRSKRHGQSRGFRKKGVYLITGGLGKLGLAIARHLAREYQATLILASRTRLPPRDGWKEFLRNCERSSKAASSIERILEIEALGSEVLVASVDFGNLQEVAALAMHYRRSLRKINGIIHAAGVVDHRLFEEITPTSALEVMKSKMNGTVNIDEAFSKDDLDFLILFSSLSTTLPTLGMTEYTSANAFMDAFATRPRRSTGRLIAVNWDRWIVGDPDADILPLSSVTRELPGNPITNSAGIWALHMLLESDASRIVVSGRKVHWANIEETRGGSGLNTRSDSSDNPSATAVSMDRYARPELLEPYVEPVVELEKAIAELWAELLKLEKIGLNDDFFQLGGNSLIALRMISRLRSRFQVELTARELFDATTIRAVARVVEDKLVSEIEALET